MEEGYIGEVVVPALLALLVILAMSAWSPDRPVDTLKPRWAQPPSQFIPLQGMMVHLRDEGPRNDPEPIVLIHGTSASLHTWDEWTKVLSINRRVIRFDLPGFGLTGPAPDANYTVARYTTFVDDMLSYLEVDKAVVAGSSLGGCVAWHSAVALPQKVTRLILIGSSGYSYEPEYMPLGFKLAKFPFLEPIISRVLPRSVVESSVAAVYGDPGKVRHETVDLYYDLAVREGNRKALMQRLAQSPLGLGEDSELVVTIAQPALLIWGAKDLLVPVSNAHKFAKDIKRNDLVIFPQLGHIPQEEDPAATLAVAVPFLQQPL